MNPWNSCLVKLTLELMMNESATAKKYIAIWLVLLAAGGACALTMGVTFLSTVPPTVGLVAKMFGTANMAILFGMLMMAHQIGGFFGAYLGGYVFQATGSYDWVWYIDMVLAVGAALVNLPIREARLPGVAMAA